MTKTKTERMKGRKVTFSFFNQFREKEVSAYFENPFNALVR